MNIKLTERQSDFTKSSHKEPPENSDFFFSCLNEPFIQEKQIQCKKSLRTLKQIQSNIINFTESIFLMWFLFI